MQPYAAHVRSNCFRRDRYNKKLWKYHVVLDEENHSDEANEERERQESATTKKVKCNNLRKTNAAAPEMPESDQGEDSEEERSKHADNTGAKARAIKGLDDSIALLEQQFELAEQTKADVGELAVGVEDSSKRKELFGPAQPVGTLLQKAARLVANGAGDPRLPTNSPSAFNL
eukprot:s66_g43.t1